MPAMHALPKPELDDRPTFPVASLGDLLRTHESRQQLGEALATLPERLRLLLSLRYAEELTLAEIAQVLHLSRPRVRRLHHAAVEHLQRAMAA